MIAHNNSHQGSPHPAFGSMSAASGSTAGSSYEKIKCVFLGDGAVGKTSLIVSYTTNGYPSEYIPTAIDTYDVVVHVSILKNMLQHELCVLFIYLFLFHCIMFYLAQVDGEPVTFEMCDTPGQDDFDTLRPLVYPNTDVFLLCFSVVLPSSFHNIREKWIPEIRKSTQKNKKKIKSKNQKDDIPIVLVGTQSDLRNDAQTLVELAQYKETPVSEADARKLVQSMGFDDYIESSSLTQKNLKEVFDSAIMAGLKGRAIKEKKAAKQRYKISQKQQRGGGCLGMSSDGQSACSIL